MVRIGELGVGHCRGSGVAHGRAERPGLARSGTSSSFSPCSTKNGGASLCTYEIGDAASNRSGVVRVAGSHDELLEERQHHLVHVLGVGEVVDAVIRHRRLDRRVGVFEPGLKRRVVGRERGQRSEVRHPPSRR